MRIGKSSWHVNCNVRGSDGGGDRNHADLIRGERNLGTCNRGDERNLIP